MDKYGGYLGILKWSLAQTDGTAPTNFSRMSKEDREWLAKAMEEYLVDEVQLIKDCVKVVVTPDADDAGQAEALASLPHVAVEREDRGASAAGREGAAAGGAGGAAPGPSAAMTLALEDLKPTAAATGGEAAAAAPLDSAATTAAPAAAAEAEAPAGGSADVDMAADAGADGSLETKDAEGGAGGAGAEAGEAASTPPTGGMSLLASKEEALERLAELVETIDRGRDLHLVGGLRPIVATLRSSHPSLVWRAANVLATASQNNPIVQKWALQFGVVPELLRDIDPANEHSNEKVRVKALTACSAVVRGSEAATAAFIEGGGVKHLVALLARPIAAVAADADEDSDEVKEVRQQQRVRRKAAFFLMHLTAHTSELFEQARDAVITSGIAAAAAAALRVDDGEVQENTARLLAALVSGARSTPLRDEDGLGAAVAERLAVLESHAGEDREFEKEERIALTAVSMRLAAHA